MELFKKQFDILVCLLDNPGCKQRELQEETKYSLGTVNRTLKELTDCGYVKNGEVTAKGVEALEPYRVKRAIFLAAGFGSRLVPITLNTPKSLIRVNGQRIIDTLLDAVVEAEIPEIIIVRGYLGEQFDQLLYKYPNIKFLENPIFNESNNISSAMCVRYLMQNAYVLESDLILKNKKLIRKYEYQTNILGIKREVTDDWCVSDEGTGFVVNETVGGVNCYQMVGISFWSEKDGSKLSQDIKTVYEAPGGKERFWEQTALVYKKEHYKVAIRECSEEDVTEIDTFSELKKIDKTYGL